MQHGKRSRLARTLRTCGLALVAAGVASAAAVWMSADDFRVPGTLPGDVRAAAFKDGQYCRNCHGDWSPETEPYGTWAGSLMANGGRDPLFFAQMATANQDVPGVGTYCLRCHVPLSVVSGHVDDPTGSSLDARDRDGVTCHLCHSMVDPIYKPDVSPPEDAAILRALAERPRHFGNAMFVLDPEGTRRGPRRDVNPPHKLLHSPFHRTSELCGTCHDVGNVATTRQSDGTWRYNAPGVPADDPDPLAQFPLERTYTEWKLSEFARGGVDLGGRFGGEGVTVVSTCQDCHMPRATGQACFFGPVRDDLRVHRFAGAAAQVLEMIALQGGPGVDYEAIERGRRAAMSMLRSTASLEFAQSGGALRVRVVNHAGHKLPTGHIEGRRVWLNVRFRNATGDLLHEYGGYDHFEARLDEGSTRVYEMNVGLSRAAAASTGLPAGRTTHMALSDTIVKDNRIPPRGFSNAEYEAAGAPVVGHSYADGQYWDDAWFTIPLGAARAEVELDYQSMPREYIDHLREENRTDTWGDTLHDLWQSTGRGPPIAMTTGDLGLARFLAGDVDDDCEVDAADAHALLAAWGRAWHEPGFEPRADLDGDHRIGPRDWLILRAHLGERCP